jgi:hypothetical protein
MKRLKVLSYYDGNAGTYCSVKPYGVSQQWLMDVCARAQYLGFLATTPLELHLTVIHSEKGLSLPQQHRAYNEQDLGVARTFESIPAQFVHWAGHDNTGYVVLELESPALSQLNSWFRTTFNMPVSFDEYRAHVSIVTDAYSSGIDPAQRLVDLLNSTPKPANLDFMGLRIENLN